MPDQEQRFGAAGAVKQPAGAPPQTRLVADSGDKAAAADVEDEVDPKLETLLDAAWSRPIDRSTWESKVNERFPGLFQFRVDFHAMVEILDYEGEIERTMLGWVRAD